MAKDLKLGTEGNDTIVSSNPEGGTLLGFGGDDVLRVAPGVAGDFTLIGGTGNDTLEGRDGNDTLLGDDGNDGMSGASGNDTLLGGAGNDSMLGGFGDDQLVGGFGVDRMGGGAGVDIFAFSAGDNGIGAANRDVIVDFTQGTDHIQLAAGATWTQGFVGGAPNSNSLINITYADSSQGQVAFTSRILFNNSDFTA